MGRVTVVFGGSSGIGEAVSHRFAAGGERVVVVASSMIVKAEAVAAAIAAGGGDAVARSADVRDPDAVNRLFAQIAVDEGGIDVLVNCAGIFKPTPVGEADLDVVNQMIDVNLRGTFTTINAAVPHLRARGGGKIVNIASVAAVVGIGTYSVYCATKAAVAMLTRSLAIELAPQDININSIAPGNTATPMNEDIRSDPEFAPVLAAMKTATPSKHVYSQPGDIAELAWYLASPAARAMHGSTVLIDEGLSAGI